jgi:hypothetical protein
MRIFGDHLSSQRAKFKNIFVTPCTHFFSFFDFIFFVFFGVTVWGKKWGTPEKVCVLKPKSLPIRMQTWHGGV